MPQTINSWLGEAQKTLEGAGVESYGLDSELILADELGRDRTYLHAHPELELDKKQIELLNKKIMQRVKRVPLAYIRGYKEFYGRRFVVTPDVLVPRPESEAIIDMTRGLDVAKAIDVGTGSGALGITLKLENPSWDVTISDISPAALKIASKNAQELSSDVLVVQDDLLGSFDREFDLIVANLPYVDREWEVSKETEMEPDIALFAEDGGLELIKRLLYQAPKSLNSNGYVILEADECQHAAIISCAKEKSFRHVRTEGLILLLQIG